VAWGGAIVLLTGLIALLSASWGIDQARFAPGAILALRIASWAAMACLALFLILRPLLRRVSDEQVALYLEENEPTLDASVLSALQVTRDRAAEGDRPGDLGHEVVRLAAERCRTVEDGRQVDRGSLTRASGALAVLVTAAAVLFLAGPTFLGTAGPLILRPWSTADAASPYAVDVDPGNLTVPRGADVRIGARLINFDAGVVELSVQRGADAAWERFPMTSDPETGDFAVLLFDVDRRTEYFVEAEGVRSGLFRIDVVDLPYVDRIDLEYRFPEYSGLEPRYVEGGGDIVALRGTVVGLRITSTIPVGLGWLTMDDGSETVLAPGPDGRLSGEIEVWGEAFYRVWLEGPDGTRVEASPEFRIEALDDLPPAVSFERPGRDVAVTSVDEVFAEVRAEDDYGVARLDLVYRVNGGAEDTVVLYGTRGAGRRELARGHTLYLEDLELQPGDLISYYARARESWRGPETRSATTDLYFVEIRPFDRRFRQADQAGGQQGGGMGMQGDLSEQQRQIIAATFRLIRESESGEADSGRRSEDIATLALVQARLRQQVETLVERMLARGITADSTFAVIARELPLAAEEMLTAEEALGSGEADSALPPEQQALAHLQRAEAAFRETQVGRGQDGGGGGGGGQGDAEDLADLFELELDRMRNQYESVQRDQRQQQNEEVDEALQRVQELARRQQQINERMRQEQESGAGGEGVARQGQLAEETEELARQLERLSRESGRQELASSARRMREAAESMRRSSAERGEQGRAEGTEAVDRLREARQSLENSRSEGLRRDLQDARNRAERLRAQQDRIQAGVDRIESAGPDREERVRRLTEDKEQQFEELAELEADLDRLSREARSDSPETARALREASGVIRDSKLKEKIRFSRGVIRERSDEYARNFEREIGRDFDKLIEGLDRADDALRAEGGERRLEDSLDDAQGLVQGLESMRDRTQQMADSGSPPTGAPMGLSAEDARQSRREIQERLADVERLRDDLAREGVDVGDLGEVIAGLRPLDDDRAYGDLEEVLRLQEAVIQGLKEFEFTLRREAAADAEDRVFLSPPDEVPPGYRDQVEEYYRSLSGENR
jgi:hypothetical protein